MIILFMGVVLTLAILVGFILILIGASGFLSTFIILDSILFLVIIALLLIKKILKK